MLRLLLTVAFALWLTGCGSIRAAKLHAPGWFGFEEVAPNIYVDTPMPPVQQKQRVASVATAKQRVAAFFGSALSQPEVFACSTEPCYRSFGGTSDKGRAYGGSMLLLSPRGLDPVIAAHELTHIELRHRIGMLRSWRALPSWFDEGLAVLVSDDPRYTEDGWLAATDGGQNAPALSEIGKSVALGGDWQTGYGTARHAVGRWYANAGRAGLLDLIAALRSGASFESALPPIR
ncbi:MAG: hypothetical protein ABI589_00200 [Burkholderiales bacterium]